MPIQRMHFVHQTLRHPSVYLKVVWLQARGQNVFAYFRRTCMDLVFVDEGTFEVQVQREKAVPFEIEDVASAAGGIFVKTRENCVVRCTLDDNMELKVGEQVHMDDSYRHSPQRLHPLGDSVLVSGGRHIGVVFPSGKYATLRPKNDVISIEARDAAVLTIERGAEGTFFNIYEVCADVILHKTMLAVGDTSYMLARTRSFDCVLSGDSILLLAEGRVHSSLQYPDGTGHVACKFFDSQSGRLYLVSENGSLLAIEDRSRAPVVVGTVGPVSAVSVFRDCVLTLGNRNTVYRLFGEKKGVLVPVGQVCCADACGTEEAQGQGDDPCATGEAAYWRRALFHGSRESLNCAIRRLRCAEIPSCLKERRNLAYRGKGAVRGEKCVFFWGEDAYLLCGNEVLRYRIFEDAAELMSCGVSGGAGADVCLSYAESNKRLLRSLFEAHSQQTGRSECLSWRGKILQVHKIDTGSLVLCKEREFWFKIGGVCAVGRFAVLQEGSLIWVFDHEKGKMAFLQVVDGSVSSLFAIGAFVYVGVGEDLFLAYKMDRCTGFLDIPVRISMQERILRAHNGVVFGKAHLYLFVAYDFVAIEAPEGLLGAAFSGRELCVCTETGTDFLRIGLLPVLGRKFREEGPVCRQPTHAGPTEVGCTGKRRRVCNCTYTREEHLREERPKNERGGYDIRVSAAGEEWRLELLRGGDPVSCRKFAARPCSATSLGTSVVCAFGLCCVVLRVGKKQLVVKSRRRLPSRVLEIRSHRESVFVRTHLHSILRFSLENHRLVLVCSDALCRTASWFEVIGRDMVLVCDSSNAISLLQQIEGQYEPVMSVTAACAVKHIDVNTDRVLYQTVDGEVGEIFCVDRDTFSLLRDVCHGQLLWRQSRGRTLFPDTNVARPVPGATAQVAHLVASPEGSWMAWDRSSIEKALRVLHTGCPEGG